MLEFDCDQTELNEIRSEKNSIEIRSDVTFKELKSYTKILNIQFFVLSCDVLILPWNHCYSRMESFPHALQPVFEYDSNWSFECLAMIFVDALRSQPHYNWHKLVAGPMMAYSMTFDCSYRKMVAYVGGLDLECVPNSHKCLANCCIRHDPSAMMDQTM